MGENFSISKKVNWQQLKTLRLVAPFCQLKFENFHFILFLFLFTETRPNQIGLEIDAIEMLPIYMDLHSTKPFQWIAKKLFI